MRDGVALSKEAISELNGMRLEHQLSFNEIGRMVNASGETVRKALKHGSSIRDFHEYALMALLAKYRAGELKFENGKAVPAPAPAESVQP